jgi:hypothetical protein
MGHAMEGGALANESLPGEVVYVLLGLMPILVVDVFCEVPCCHDAEFPKCC